MIVGLTVADAPLQHHNIHSDLTLYTHCFIQISLCTCIITITKYIIATVATRLFPFKNTSK